MRAIALAWPGFQFWGSGRCRANMAHIRQSGPDSGVVFQVKVLEIFAIIPCSLGSG